MKIFCSPEHAGHYPKHFLVNGRWQPNPESPERVERLLEAVRRAEHEPSEPGRFGRAPIAAVHSAEYLHFLEHAHARWRRTEGAGEEVVPNVQPNRFGAAYPASVAGQAGYHLADCACPIGAGTWRAALASAECAVSAARSVLDGARQSYALCRPPGHHAFADLAGGFCYLNNTAIAAEDLCRRLGRVAVLDVDLHHGNGTQGIFYARGDVLTVSIHADPTRFYPFFWGHAQERGAGAGCGANLNLPLARGSDDETYLAALERALARIDAFAPEAVVVALGLDAFAGDPLAGLAVTTEGFARIARRIGALAQPLVLVQEGGYVCDALGDNLAAFLGGVERARSGG